MVKGSIYVDWGVVCFLPVTIQNSCYGKCSADGKGGGEALPEAMLHENGLPISQVAERHGRRCQGMLSSSGM